MKRRTFLTTGMLLLAGCTTQSDGTPQTIALNAEGVSPSDSTATLRATYSGETKLELETDPPTQAEDGHKWLIVELSITNEGEETHETSPSRYVVRINGNMYEIVVTDGSRPFKGKEMEPGKSVTGEIVFHIPEETNEATLTVRDDVDIPRPVTVTFTRVG